MEARAVAEHHGAALSSACCVLPAEGPLRCTPAELVAKLRLPPGGFWLDKGDAQGAIGLGRMRPMQPALRSAGILPAWSYVGPAPERVVACRDGEVAVTSRGERRSLGRLPFLDVLRQELRLQRRPFRFSTLDPQLSTPPFRGGWFAALAYDLGRQLERLPRRAADDLPFPELHLAFHRLVLAFDHATGRWWAGGLVPAGATARERERYLRQGAEALLRDLAPRAPADAQHMARDTRDSSPLSRRPTFNTQQTTDHKQHTAVVSSCSAVLPKGVVSNFNRSDYEAAVARVLEYIAAGDVYQVNLSQRFRAPVAQAPSTADPAFDLYMALRRQSPAPYGVFAPLGDGRAVCSISPELFLRVRGAECVTRPIKGTRPRGAGPEQDRGLRDELEASAKERAELTMIVDLERNDLGRACEYGSVRVVSPGEIEAHPTVFHRVATVAGRLRQGVGLPELLRATFPGGSVTGAPKIRAMEIIEELEPVRRGLYCGALGWLGLNGDLELSLAIRTALVDEGAGSVWYQAGGGIVAESDPAREYEETLAKAAAFFRACRAGAACAGKPR